MPVEIETFGSAPTSEITHIEPGTFGVIKDFDLPKKIYVFCDPQDQRGVIPAIQVVHVEGKVGYDVQLYADDDDLTGEVIDLTAPVEFSGSVTIGIATRTIGRVVFLRHVRSQGLAGVPPATLVAAPV